MDIEGLGAKLIEQLVEEDRIANPAEIYELDKEELAERERMGEKSAENLIKAIEASKNLSRFLDSLGIREVGDATAASVASYFGNLPAIIEATTDQLMKVPDVGPVVAARIRDFLDEDHNLEVITRLQDLGVHWKDEDPMQVSEDGPLSGHSFVITGTLPGMTRDDAKALIQSNGGKVTSKTGTKTRRRSYRYRQTDDLDRPLTSEPLYLIASRECHFTIVQRYSNVAIH